MSEMRRRTIALDNDLDARLLVVCKAFGVNPHAYIISKIGDSVVKDEILINSKNTKDDVYAAIHSLLAGVTAEAGIEKIE
jgi:hypothetical protein